MNARAGQHAQGAVTSLAVLGLLSNALVWGLSWWPFKHLQAQGLHPLWATSLVYALSFAALLLWVWLRGQRLRQDFAHPGLWCLLLAAGMTNVGFNWAVTIGDVVRVVLLFYLMPAWTVLLAWGLLGERPTRAALLRLALALLGLWVVLHTPQQPWPLPRSLADALALLGGFSFALANVLLLKLKHTRESSRMLAIFGGDTFMAAAVAALVGASAPSLPALASNAALLWLLLGLALAVLLGNLGLLYGAARLPAQTTALVMLSEVVVASVSSVALGAGQWELRTAVGGGLILLAALLSVLKGKQACN